MDFMNVKIGKNGGFSMTYSQEPAQQPLSSVKLVAPELSALRSLLNTPAIFVRIQYGEKL